jgi:prepilin-type N-terminal cleavage/methylation domain-containing protein
MTLVEVLVVISIMGVFMGIAIPSVVQSFNLISRVKQMTARYPNARKTLDRMSEKIRQTFPATLKSDAGFVGKSDSVEAGDIMLPYDELSFPILDTDYAHLRSVHKISYRLDLGSPEDKTVLRGLVEKRSFIGSVEDAGAEETVWDRVVGLDFRYLDDSAEPAEWIEEWPPPSPGKDARAIRTPAAVRITIFAMGVVSPEPRTFTTVVNVPSR